MSGLEVRPYLSRATQERDRRKKKLRDVNEDLSVDRKTGHSEFGETRIYFETKKSREHSSNVKERKIMENFENLT